MANNEGDKYENNIANLLKKNQLLHPSFVPAGSDRVRPDAQIQIKGVYYAIEIKLSIKAFFGQGGIRYNLASKQFVFSEQENTVGARVFRNIANAGLTKINSAWERSGIPRTGVIEPEYLTKQDVEIDKKNFNEKTTYQNIDAGSVRRYYTAKGIDYIQIGGCGLFCLERDPADLGVPRLDGAFYTLGRIKYETKKTGRTYSRFTMAMRGASVSVKTDKNLEDLEYLKVLAQANK